MKVAELKKGEGIVFSANTPKPNPEKDMICLKVEFCGFCGSDHSIVEMARHATGSINGKDMDGTILGHEFVATIDSFGSEIAESVKEELRKHKRYTVRPSFCGACPACLRGQQVLCRVHKRTTGIGDLPGGFAEYLVCYPSMLIPVPDNLPSEDAALAELFAASYHGLKRLQKLMPNGRSALVMGGGPIGLAMLQLLKVAGYSTIILSEPKPEKQKLALSMGATHALDPLHVDFKSKIAEIAESVRGKGIDSIFECSGIMSNIPLAVELAGDGAVICVVSINFTKPDFTLSNLAMYGKELSLISSVSNTHEENIRCLQWLADGLLDAQKLISHRCTLEELPAVYKDVICSGLSTKVMVTIASPLPEPAKS